MAGVVTVGFALIFVGLNHRTQETVDLTETIEKQRTEIAAQTTRIEGLDQGIGI